MSVFDQLLDELAQRVAAVVVERLRGGEPGMVDQARSPLGSRRHCAATKRRLARGEPGAAVVGRRHLLSPEALSEELGRASGGKASRSTAAGGVAGELRAELALLKGGRRG